MLEFEKEVEEINNILEKGDKISLAAAEIRAEKLKKKVQRTECLERDARIAKIEVIIGTAQAFLGKFDSAMRNLEGALRKHISFDVLNLCDTVKALTMLDISKNRIDVIHEAGILIDDFREFRMAARSLLE